MLFARARTGALVFNLTGHKRPLTSASSDDWTARVLHCTGCEPLPGLERLGEARLAALR